jgi:hypothetical protein
MGKTKPFGFEFSVFGREQPTQREMWMARNAVPGGIVTAIVLGLSAGLAFAISAWWLGVILGVVYAAVGVAVWAQTVRKVGRWHRKQREADRLFGSSPRLGRR